MIPAELTSRISARALAAGAPLDGRLADGFATYFSLLSKWNRTTNLTSLDLADPSPASLDRLFIEPLLAARHLGGAGSRLLDVGSGGGSPAIPLALALRTSVLHMVEARTRKAVFLREAARALELDTVVHADRVETVDEAGGLRAAFDFVSIRAVRLDAAVLGAAERFLSVGGRLLSFQPQEASNLSGWDVIDRVAVPSGIVLIASPENVPRGTSSFVDPAQP